MTQGAAAGTVRPGATSILRAFFKDAFGTLEETEVGYSGKCLSWRVDDWRGTVSESFDIHKYGFAGVTTGLPQIASSASFRGLDVVGGILRITDTHNTVADRLVIEPPNSEAQRYRQFEASTIEDVDQSSSTFMQRELTRHVEKYIDRLFESAGELYFEDGMETDFSRELVSLIQNYGNLVMGEISYLISCGRVDDEVAREALQCLARIDDPLTYGWRLWLLEKSLSSKSPMVRDGAGVGLVSMCDAHAIQYIRKAIEQETITGLCCDLQGALEELEASLDAASAKDNSQV